MASLEEELATNGVLTSLNFPNNYPRSTDQVQKIQVPEGNTIWIRFTDFYLERDDATVTITDKDGTRLGLFDRGANWRQEIVSSTDTVEVLFRTGRFNTAKGWRLDWSKYNVSINFVPSFTFSQEWLEMRACRRVVFCCLPITPRHIPAVMTTLTPSKLQRARPSDFSLHILTLKHLATTFRL